MDVTIVKLAYTTKQIASLPKNSATGKEMVTLFILRRNNLILEVSPPLVLGNESKEFFVDV